MKYIILLLLPVCCWGQDSITIIRHKWVQDYSNPDIQHKVYWSEKVRVYSPAEFQAEWYNGQWYAGGGQDTTKSLYRTYLKYQHLWDEATKKFDKNPSEKGLKEMMRYQDSTTKYYEKLKK